MLIDVTTLVKHAISGQFTLTGGSINFTVRERSHFTVTGGSINFTVRERGHFTVTGGSINFCFKRCLTSPDGEV